MDPHREITDKQSLLKMEDRFPGIDRARVEHLIHDPTFIAWNNLSVFRQTISQDERMKLLLPLIDGFYEESIRLLRLQINDSGWSGKEQSAAFEFTQKKIK